MGKVAKKLPEEYKQKAIANNISLQTVYQRLQRGWDLEKAVTKVSHRKDLKRSEDGTIISGDRPKTTKSYAFCAYQDNQELLEKAIEKSGKSQSVFLADIVDTWLKRNKKKINS